MRILERYFDAIRSHGWETLGDCVTEDVHRTGPYLDVIEGRQAYVEFLARIVPSLPNYSLVVRRIHPLAGGSAVAEIAESLDLGGVQTEIPEALFFDFADDGRIRRVDIYIKKPPGTA